MVLARLVAVLVPKHFSGKLQNNRCIMSSCAPESNESLVSHYPSQLEGISFQISSWIRGLVSVIAAWALKLLVHIRLQRTDCLSPCLSVFHFGICFSASSLWQIRSHFLRQVHKTGHAQPLLPWCLTLSLRYSYRPLGHKCMPARQMT